MTVGPMVPTSSAPVSSPFRLRGRLSPLGGALPGLLLVGGGVALSAGMHRLVPSIGVLVAAVVAGALLTNLGLVPDACRRGCDLAARRLLRAGVVLLGFQLAAGDLLRLGLPQLVVVAATVGVTFVGTRWLGARLGVSASLSLLIATGFSICGASAIAAMRGVSDADEDDVAFSIGLVTLCGSVAILLLPLLRGPAGLDDGTFGAWVGASVHDVAQVVATAASGGGTALQTAVVVKLTRVVLLAPLVSCITLLRRRSGTGVTIAGAKRPPLVPLFVAGFLTAIALRSTGAVPDGVLAALRTVETLVLAAALFGLGTGVNLARLRRLGGRPLLLGLAAWLLVASVSYVGIRLVGAG